MSDEEPIKIFMNTNIKNWSRGKYAAHAVHAALEAFGVHPGVPVVVLGAKPREIEEMRVSIHDAGKTELEPGTLTAGTNYVPGTETPVSDQITEDEVINSLVGLPGIYPGELPYGALVTGRVANALNDKYGFDQNTAVSIRHSYGQLTVNGAQAFLFYGLRSHAELYIADTLPKAVLRTLEETM